MRSERNRADYDLWHKATRRKADEIVERARSVIEALEAAQADAAVLAAITLAMRAYERDTLKIVTWQP